MTRCKLCKKLGEREHKRQELRLIMAVLNWATKDVAKESQNWKRLERAAMAYGRKRK